MKTSSLESKTIRPGLGAYSFYHSDRHLRRESSQVIPVIKRSKTHTKRNLMVLVVLMLIGFGGYTLLNNNNSEQLSSSGSSGGSNQKVVGVTSPPEVKPNVSAASVNKCGGNDLPQFIVISITDRHLWACEGNKQVRDYPVITGMQKIEENATPPGTYKIYAKQRDTVLSGTASTGSWREPVSYWMPFLDNNFGTYGFHDASWRKASEFGNTDPYSNNGSHGCIQMSVTNTEWLYSWAHVGATVSIYL